MIPRKGSLPPIRMSFGGTRFATSASWKGKQDLSSLKGEVIKVRLLMTNSKLYSFTLSETE